ncbi:hypothetical protein HDU93_008756 [Gonapodya sp. JEL0774]|nr:hypothetical protein HDU93_008756 [Gonapodya sp. JEL0774]
MVPKKAKSKRLPARQKYKIERRVREHHRKQRKETKADIARGIKPAAKKDPGIPNLFPFKEKLLRQAEESKRQREEEKQRQSDARRALQSKNRKLPISTSDLSDLAADAAARSASYELDHGAGAELNPKGAFEADEEAEAVLLGTRDNSRKAYYKEFRKVVEESDVILEVLDARDPLGTRTKEIERAILDSGVRKRIVLVLNKIDLVPQDVVAKWLKYLRSDFPTIAFKSSTQQQRTNLARASKGAAPGQGGGSFGADNLMQLLKNYSRNSSHIKSSVTVGVIGFPNVGKSSIINSLKRSRVAATGATPGVTKTTQLIQLDKNVRLVDSPGIVFGKSKKDGGDDGEVLLRNCVKVELVEDPAAPVEIIISRCRAEALRHIYDLPEFADARDFLVQLARKTGRLRKGGVPDTDSAARMVLRDWNGGRIPYYTVPPSENATDTSLHADASIVEKWSKEFELPEIVEVEKEGLTAKGTFLEGKGVPFAGGLGGDLEVDMEGGNGEEEEEEMSSAGSDDEADVMDEDDEGEDI